MADKTSVENRLAVYGSLAPGRPNEHVLAALAGSWCKGTVKGRLVQDGWGVTLGFPGLVLDPLGYEVSVEVFEAAGLPSLWESLDAFEGAGYQRVQVDVSCRVGMISAYIYALRD
jgi:gamma-glutamylcyclotransferase (GGCT)/AIG2-like uncharacterized protein YtfP